jgi:hypothetical protein
MCVYIYMYMYIYIYIYTHINLYRLSNIIHFEWGMSVYDPSSDMKPEKIVEQVI